MKLKLTIFALSFVIISSNYAMQLPQKFALPETEILEQRLMATGFFTHFMEKTGIVRQLAGKSFSTCGLIMKIEEAYDDYNEFNKRYADSPMKRAAMMQSVKPILIQALLQDYPIALSEALEFYKK
jgi:hypothetical protein